MFGGRLFLWGMRFGIAVVLARTLGVTGYGAYNLALGVATIASLLPPLGFDAAIVRYTAIFAGRRDWPRFHANLRFMVGLPAFLSLLVAGGLAALALPIAETIMHDRQYAPLVIISAAMVPTMVLSAQLVGALRGLKRMGPAVLAEQVGQPIVRLALLVPLLIAGISVLGALAAWTVASWVTTALLALILLSALRRLPYRGRSKPDAAMLLRYSAPLFVSNLVVKSGIHLQSILLGTISTVGAVGVFAVASNVNLIGSLFHSSLVAAAMPIFAQLQDRKDHGALERLYQVTSKWSFTLNLPLFLTIITYPQALLAVFGPGFQAGAVPLAILAGANLVNAGTGMSSVLLDMTGHTALKAVNATVAVAGGIILNLILVPPLGLIGAALAFFAVTAIANILPLVEVLRLERVSPYSAAFLKPATAGGAAILASLATRTLLGHSENLVTAAIGIAVILATYTIVLVQLGIDDDDRILWRRAIRRLSRGGRGTAAPPNGPRPSGK